jgi:arsenite methyltransferase
MTLNFDAETSRLLDNAYQGADVTRRRRANFDALAPAPGDRILDIGCGTGLLTQELARAVGVKGQVTGVDPSADMRKLAIERCSAFANVNILEAAANQLATDDGSFDKALSVQVFEYLSDIPGALREAHRVLRPGGLLVIGDMHWDSLVWFSADQPRMADMLAGWDRHLVERCVPALLPNLLSNAGFCLERIEPVTFCDTTLKPDGLAIMMLHLMQAFALQHDLLP